MKRMKFDRSFQLPVEGDLRKKTYGGERGGGGGVARYGYYEKIKNVRFL